MDIKKKPTMIQFTVKISKTGPLEEGVCIVIRETADELCPVVVFT